MELLAGEADYEVTVKESGCVFRFDFSSVYWNPRLGTEHDRVIRMVSPSSILFDACAGVGPFSVPCGKICKVLSNDLNPDSYKWLVENVRWSLKRRFTRMFVITEKAPTRAFSWLKVPTSPFTFKTLC